MSQNGPFLGEFPVTKFPKKLQTRSFQTLIDSSTHIGDQLIKTWWWDSSLLLRKILNEPWYFCNTSKICTGRIHKYEAPMRTFQKEPKMTFANKISTTGQFFIKF